jgi:hypothetical protein
MTRSHVLITCVVALLGCGSQQLRLTAPDTTAGISYTCTAANTCYPASLAAPIEGQPDEALPLVMPRECGGQIHEIVIREPDSSEPEIDVTCAAPKAKPAAKAPPQSEHEPVDATGIAPLP